MIIEAFTLSILIGFIRKGRLHNLGQAPLRYFYVFIIPFAILAGMMLTSLAGKNTAWQPYVRAANIVQYATILAAVALNLHMRELWSAAVGTFLNLLVIAANGGVMPMSARALRVAGLHQMLDPERTSRFIRHAIMTPDTRLKPLADIIPVPGFALIAQVASIGDLLISVAVFVFVQRYMLAPAADVKGKTTGE